jgi:uncharacterized glyoxalase superfamily protein PhnB
MDLSSFYPVICTDRVAETASFYIKYFDFEVVFEVDWYASLKRDGDPAYELAILDASHDSLPFGKRYSVSGLLLNFEVADVDAEYRRLVEHGGLEPLLRLRDEEFGQRHFILEDPAGVLIDVIKMIPFSGKFADAEVAQR